MYVEFFFRRERSVENSVESVEFHTQKGLENLNFKLSPPSFPLVENSRGIYRGYTGGFVENFCLVQNWRIIRGLGGNPTP